MIKTKILLQLLSKEGTAMTDTNTMADNGVRCNSNGNGMSNSMANSDGDIRVGSSAVVGDLDNVAIALCGYRG